MIDAREVAAGILRDRGLDDRRVRVVHLNRSGPQGDFVVLIVFSGGRATPSLLIKLTRDPEKAAFLRREFDNLTLLHESGSAALRRSIPEPVRLDEIQGTTIFAETAVPGKRIKNLVPDRYFRSDRFRGHLDDVVSFLGELHRCGEARLPPGTPSIDAGVARYRELFETSAELGSLLEETADYLRERPVPTSPLHGDFCTANILVEDGEPIGVIDWEFPLHREWPLADLLHFLSSVWCIPYGKGRAAAIERYRALFFGEHALRDAIRDRSRSYAEAIGLGEVDPLYVSVACWLLYAIRKHEALPASNLSGRDEDQWPLVIFEERRCVNLELLAEHRGSYLLGGLSPNHSGKP